VDEVVAAVDGRDGGGEGGGARGEELGELVESGGVEPVAIGIGGRKLWRRCADVAGGVQPRGLSLWSQVVIPAAANCLRHWCSVLVVVYFIRTLACLVDRAVEWMELLFALEKWLFNGLLG
jgi:hypothetical protein